MTPPLALTPSRVPLISRHDAPADVYDPVRADGARDVEAMIDIDGLSKCFAVRRSLVETLRHPRSGRHAQILADVSFQVGRGELFGLLGPNGAGKTTLFKILSTLVTPDAGTATIGGHEIQEEPERVREVLTPVVADERSLNWRLSARENLRLYGVLHGLRGSHLRERIEQTLAVVRLDQTAAKPVGQFSSGMKQRLLTARALLHQPRVLLLDEPTRSLDPISAREFRALIRQELIGEQGCTVLLATHNPEEALALCDRIAILDRGRLVTVGSPRALADALLGERYAVWTRTPRHPAFDALVRDGRIASAAVVDETPAGGVVEIRLDGIGADPSDILATLVLRGTPVSRFELAPFTLADVIERAISSAREVTDA
jgi:ABC-2 type transport system ATP-binding protein